MAAIGSVANERNKKKEKKEDALCVKVKRMSIVCQWTVWEL